MTKNNEFEMLVSVMNLYKGCVPKDSRRYHIADDMIRHNGRCISEKDYYAGEINDVILDAVNTVGPRYECFKELVSDYVKKHNYVGNSSKLLSKLKSILNGYKKVNSRMIKDLEKLGFNVNKGKKHYKVVFHADCRYHITMSCTPSDVNAGKNVYDHIRKIAL